jgi:acyl-CoA reductase-like NAD-dependent aldehyde dehydrogenase
MGLRAHRESVAAIVAAETGKSYADALGETDGATSLGSFSRVRARGYTAKPPPVESPVKWP